MALFALVLCLLLAGPSPGATGARDTTISDQTYALLPVESLAAQLRQGSLAPLRYRHTAFAGRLDARMAGIAEVRPPLELEDVRFLDQLVFDGVVFRAPVQGTGLSFARGLSLLGARFEQGLSLEAGEWRGPFSANQAVFAGTTRLENSYFFATASFIGARFEGPSSLARCRFEEGVFFEETHFAGPVSFADAYFEALSSFKRAAWQAGASFAGVRFKDRSFFWNASFAGPASFDEARFGSETSFNQAHFAQAATFRRLTFVHPAHFDQAEFAAGADFTGTHFKRLADFSDSRAAAPLELGAFFSGDLDLRHCRAPLVDLRAPAGPAPDSLADSSATARVFLQDSRCEKLLVRWDQLAGRLAAPDSADAQSLTSVYAFLEQQFRVQGLGTDVLACRAAGLEYRRQHLPWTSLEKYFLLGWWLTTGYGTSLGRFFLLSAALVLGFALLYRSGSDAFRPVQGARSFTLLSCLLFSLQTFVRVGPASWRPAGVYRWWALVQGLAGWFAWALFIAALLARMS